MPKIRLDERVMELGLAETLNEARAKIMAGEILVEGEPSPKSGNLISLNTSVALKSSGSKFVSRGGDKLEGAIKHFKIDVAGRVCLDVGASTGGFTDCLLQKGASKVFAIDVGKGQLDPKIRNHPQVIWKESFHAKDLSPPQFPHPIQLATVDVSFISLKKVLPFVSPCIATGGQLLALIKPQFEVAARELVKGVLKNEEKRMEVIQELHQFARNDLQLKKISTVDSVLKGPRGNQEIFLLGLKG